MKLHTVILLALVLGTGSILAEDSQQAEFETLESFPAGNNSPITAEKANLAMLRGVNFGNVFDQSKVQVDGTPAKRGAAWDALSLTTLKKMVDLYYGKGIHQFRMPFTWYECMDAKRPLMPSD